jgi:hypothetical protein
VDAADVRHSHCSGATGAEIGIECG